MVLLVRIGKHIHSIVSGVATSFQTIGNYVFKTCSNFALLSLNTGSALSIEQRLEVSKS